ncbi:MAG: lipopolysaccharide core heptose(I) kinase RfaP [Gammaproteobacteria bacterium]|nr:lipopolysaccharide core heptose(I) kinase RfaP [Gammaproteobacteria bacterium]
MSVWVRDDLAGALAGDPFAALEGMSKDTVRRADNRHTFRMEDGDSAYFVKMHEGVGWRQILEDLLTLKRPVVDAGNECAACRRLAQVGIRAPRVAAFGVRGANPATRQSFVVCDALEGFVSLTEVAGRWRGHPPAPSLRWQLTRELARLVRALHDAGVNHRDLYFDHVLANSTALQDGRVELALIDLHRAGLRRRVPRRWLLRDLAALSFSAAYEGATRTDQFRFLRHYTAGSPARALRSGPRFWRTVAQRAARLQAKGKRDTAARARRG